MSKSRRHLRFVIPALICLAAGAALRLAYAIHCGLGYDEVFVMGLGLDELADSPEALWFDLPVRRSDGITPLWWYVQAVPVRFVGHLSLFGLRAAPVLLGTAALLLAWRVGRRRLGRGPTGIVLALAALSEVLAFTNARGEFAESLLVAATLPAVCLVGDRRHSLVKGVLWLIILMTHLGKGVPLVGGLLVAEAVAIWLQRGERRDFGRLAIAGAMALVPAGVWLLVANGAVFADGPVNTDAGLRHSVWQAFTGLTFGYAQTKQQMVAEFVDAGLVYLHGHVWPVTSALAVPLLVGLGRAVLTAIRRRPRGRRQVLVVALLPWIVLGAGAVVGRGLVGARFHLLYLPALWVAAGIGLWQLRHLGRGSLVALGLLWASHLAVAWSWSSWLDRELALSSATLFGAGLAIAPVVGAVLTAGRRPNSWLAPAGVLAISLCVAVLVAGPWRWGPAARMEPMASAADTEHARLLADIDRARADQAEYPPPHGRTLFVDLANRYLRKGELMTPRDTAMAVQYAELETHRVPDDARGWFYLGLAYQHAGRPASQVREAWQTCYHLKPDPRVADLLDKLSP